MVWPTLTSKLVLQGLKIKVFHALVLLWFPMRMRDPHHLNIGDADSPEGSCELLKWCQVSTMMKLIDFSLE